MVDVYLVNQSLEVAERRPKASSLVKTTKEGAQKPDTIPEKEVGQESSLGDPSATRTTGMGRIVTLSAVPNEIQLEILGKLDVPSIQAMRNVNHHFRQLIKGNEEAIVRECLQTVECVGPHAILLQFYPLDSPIYCTLRHAVWTHHTKRAILRVARSCRIIENAKINALYCIQRICEQAYSIYADIEDLEFNYSILESLRNRILSPFTTSQIQHMLPTCIRLVFKIAELLGNPYQGSVLHIDDYTRYNFYLVAHGPQLINDLERIPASSRREDVLWSTAGEFPRIHDELIRFLETRGTGLMTEPGIEIQQFFQEEETILDLGER